MRALVFACLVVIGCGGDDAPIQASASSTSTGGAGGAGVGGSTMSAGGGGSEDPGPIYGDAEDPDEIALTASWMDRLLSPDTRLRDVVIPGTHNSASYAITVDSEVHADAPPEAAEFPEIAAPWSVCQYLSLTEQLDRGVRFLDIRVNEHNGELVTLHGMISITYAEAMQQIADWSTAHPREIVMITIGELPPAAMFQALADETTAGLQGLLYDTPIDPTTLTVGDVWSEGLPIIAAADNSALAALSPALHDKSTLHHGLWANSRDRADLLAKNHAFVATNQGEPRWLGIGFTFTPNEDTIVDGLFNGGPDNLYDFQVPIFDTPGAWMPGWLASDLALNVLTIDFIEWTALIPMSIRQSTVAPPAPSATPELVSDVLTSERYSEAAIHRVHSPDATLYSLGDVVSPTEAVMVRDDGSGKVIAPLGYDRVWWVDGLTMWRPIAPKGYRCLGSLVSSGPLAPPRDAMRCVHEALVTEATAEALWSDADSTQFPVTLYSGGVSFTPVREGTPSVYSF